MTNPLVELGSLGQSPWYDFITRDLITTGQLTRLIEEDGLMGMTSNPSIFQKAIAGSDLYDEDITRLATEGKNVKEVFEELAVTDVQAACDAFKDVHERSDHSDGFVSLEVDPGLARDTVGTVAEARRLWAAIDRPNAMIKIPGTIEGLPAVTTCLSEGINVNVTLLFSVTRYERVIEAFVHGLESRASQGLPLGGLASVASFFVSRLDGKVDAILDARNGDSPVRGKTAIANACQAYATFERAFADPRWPPLAARGGAVQRPLWASTSTKDPAYPDVYYVEALVGPHTVNTLPPATFDAYRDHGAPMVRIHEGIAKAGEILAAVAAAGIDLDALTADLEREGVKGFADSYTALLAGIEAKVGALIGR
jgi:transaldolase